MNVLIFQACTFFLKRSVNMYETSMLQALYYYGILSVHVYSDHVVTWC